MEVAVVDVGTTGLGDNAYITEIAAVGINASTGAEAFRQSASCAAGDFKSIAETVKIWVNRRVLGAYNLPFDQRMLEREFSRLGRALQPGVGVDVQVEPISLSAACKKEGIPQPAQDALSEAVAAATLLVRQMQRDRNRLSGVSLATVY